MIISHSHKFIFIKTKKTAGTSVELVLSPHLRIGDLATPLGNLLPRHRMFSKPFVTMMREKDEAIRPRNDHQPYSIVDKYFKHETQGYYAFCVERNPWDKAISAFYYLTSKYGKSENRTDAENFLDFTKSPRLKTFSDYDMYMKNDTPLVDRILRYERLTAEFDEVMLRLSLPCVTLAGTQENAQQRPKKTRALEEFYGQDLNNLASRNVRAAFAREIAYFGFEPPTSPQVQ